MTCIRCESPSFHHCALLSDHLTLTAGSILPHFASLDSNQKDSPAYYSKGLHSTRPAASTRWAKKNCSRSSWPLHRLLRECRKSSVRSVADRRYSARGVTSIVDLEMKHNLGNWAARVQRGFDLLRVECGMYSPHLDDAISQGLKTGDPVPGGGDLLIVGPYKIITVSSR